ncbi:allophanate hydrolase [Nitrosospira sp. Nsp14]|uniref:allophanate hydrolase n=1 Tax=Nitrosospira sp. Nsp14 TaxID=1855333 RepID=UPI0008F2311C|nr:allophanate hydrolase [Nitrosospira sp. Nsp14]SFH35471.1 allophanate hydrolase [Nitrosospira sp. Nsp14]
MDELFPLVCPGDIETLLRRYASGELTPSQVVERVHTLVSNDDSNAWIYVRPLEVLREYAREVEARVADMAALPLYGIPFAIKDNIDLAGVPTTAACPAYAYTPCKTAVVVQRLIDAGAIPIGKTNLDQFATGLNGTRSPYGACHNALNPDYISGGSSSGSAVALAKGTVCFSLGTDTAGSGRVPAAFNNLVGYKPTKGWLSTRGVVPACRSLDCVSIFAFTATDAKRILEVAAGYDEEDIYSRRREEHVVDFSVSGGDGRFRFGVPRRHQLQFFGNQDTARLFDRAVASMEALGGTPAEIDFAPFLETARLLYEGPRVAERYAAIKDFFELHSDQVITPVREIIEGARGYSAADAYKGAYELRRLKRETDRVWTQVDCLLTPTAGTIYTIQAMQRDPVRLNSNLGYYTNFVNLLDYAAVAVPAGFQNDGLPFGTTLVAQAHRDTLLLHLAERLQQTYALPLGATAMPLITGVLPERYLTGISSSASGESRQPGWIKVVVCGAHMSGLPLNGELTGHGGRWVATTTTSSDYKLYALPGGPPHRPGLVHVETSEQGTAIDVEVWEMPENEFGSLVARIPVPLGIGTITLGSGENVQGFLCEHYAIAQAEDISRYGGWRGYLRREAHLEMEALSDD